MPPRIAFEPVYLQFPLPLQIFLTVWFFYVGGCIGSFMNVVIFRLPRRRSVVSPPSRCPYCHSDIRWHDNLPVVGWLILRGRCRDCHAPISARYPLVELLMGLIFMTLAVEAFVPHGPWWLTNIEPREILSTPWTTLALAYVFYVLLICTLVCAAFMTWDGEAVPKRLYLPALIAGALMPMYWGQVRPWEPLLVGVGHTRWDEVVRALSVGLDGALQGFVVGMAFDLLRNLRDARGEPCGRLALALTTCGWMLGSGVVLIIAAAGSVLALAWIFVTGLSWRGARSAPLVGVTTITTLLILSGRLLAERWHYHEQMLLSLLVCWLVVIGCAALLRWLSPPPDPLTPWTEEPASDVMYP